MTNPFISACPVQSKNEPRAEFSVLQAQLLLSQSLNIITHCGLVLPSKEAAVGLIVTVLLL